MAVAKKEMLPEPPATFLLSLNAPGMGPLHRAGLGGLASTLIAIEQAHSSGQLKDTQLPGPRNDDGLYPWVISKSTVTLDFGSPTKAATYLKNLFAFAFDLRKGLIYLPGQHGGPVDDAVLAELQSALTLTFIQHNQTRKLDKEAKSFEKDAGENKPVRYEFKPCSWFKHQNGWEELIDGNEMSEKSVEVAGPLNPGAVVRHVAFPADTRIEETPQRILPLYFAIVGCVALSANRGTGVLLVPEVTDLLAFAQYRPVMTPQSPKHCQIASASDAALQAQLRVRAKGVAVESIPSVYAMNFRSTPWASQQKSRVLSLTVPGGEEQRLKRFEDALEYLPPRVAQKTEKTSTGRGKLKQTMQTITHFWADSLIRPLVADNLARDKPWYLGFSRKMTGPDRHKIVFERKGLNKMINDDQLFDDPGEQAIIRCVRSALSSRDRQIEKENKGNSRARENRWDREYERWRLAFAGSKTPDQFRAHFADLVSRGGPGNTALQQSWSEILPFLRDRRWQQARDLSLLALASYESNSPKTSNEKGKV